jgi:hypothetical protein
MRRLVFDAQPGTLVSTVTAQGIEAPRRQMTSNGKLAGPARAG